METKLQNVTQGYSKIADTKKTYKIRIPNPEDLTQSLIHFADPNVVATNDPKFMMAVDVMIAGIFGLDSVSESQMWHILDAVDEDQVTVRELYEAIKEMRKDYFVPQSGPRWCHIWKHIAEKRGEKEKQFTYHEMLREMDKAGVPMDAFEILNGENGRPRVLDSAKKPKWRMRK